MAYTTHGHHIDGTVRDTEHPQAVARCGGPGLCQQCSADALAAPRQSQISLHEQLASLYVLASRWGYYDAADFIRNTLERR